MLNNYWIQMPKISGLDTLEPCNIVASIDELDSKDSSFACFALNEIGLKVVAKSKRGVYWKKDLTQDPNYEVDQVDAEEVLKLLADYGIPLFLVD